MEGGNVVAVLHNGDGLLILALGPVQNHLVIISHTPHATREGLVVFCLLCPLLGAQKPDLLVWQVVRIGNVNLCSLLLSLSTINQRAPRMMPAAEPPMPLILP